MECEPPVGDLPMTSRTASSPTKITECHDAESEVWDQQMNNPNYKEGVGSIDQENVKDNELGLWRRANSSFPIATTI